MEYIIVSTTFADEKEAKKTANLLLEKRLVSCAQMSDIESFYHWKGEVANTNRPVLKL